jgi:MFS family permease
MGQALGSLGNGLQASPREALVGDCAPPHLKGSCYGLRQTLTVSGSIIGSLILIIMEYRSNQPLDYLFVLRLSLYPMILAFLILLFAVKDAPPSPAAQIPAKERKPFHLSRLKELPADYWVLVVIAGIFMCANYHGNFLLIHCREGGWTASWVMLVQNIATSLTAFPIGELSDKWGRDRLLLIGMSLTLFANTALAFPSQWGSLWIGLGVMLWGAQVGIVQSLILAKIADRCPAALKGTAFGFYYLSIGAGFYIANKVAGTVSQAFSLPAVFEASNVFVVLSMTLLSIQILRNRRRKI